jgi:hypothetical protein
MTKLNRLCAVLSLGAYAVSATCARCPVADVSVIAHTGEPVGKEIQHNNGELLVMTVLNFGSARLIGISATVTLYVTGKPSDTAVLYLTDVFGIQLPENKL